MKPLSWRIWGAIWSVPATASKTRAIIWRVALIITVAFTAMIFKSLTEEFQVRNNSWDGFVIGLVYVAALFGTLRLLRRRLLN